MSSVVCDPGRPNAADDRLVLHLLGEPYLARLTPSGDEVRLLGKGKPLALIAYLSVVPQHEASREFLMDLLWGGNCVRNPAHSLRNVLLQIKNAGLEDLLDARLTRCRLAHDLPSDLTALTAALQDHRPADAIALFAGDFFTSFAAPGCHEFELWAESVRHRVRTDVANAADVLVHQLMDAGRAREAAEVARRMIEVEPLGQRSRRALLEALLAAGEQLQALTEATILEQWLSAEEIEAEPATAALIAQARRGQPTSAARADAGPDELRADLIGRESEFSAIIAAWERARHGTTEFIDITAGAGVGKSRLLADVEQRLRAMRVRTIALRALPGEREVPFALLSVLVTRLVALSGAAAVSQGTASVLIGLNASLGTVLHAAADLSDHDKVLRRAHALQELLSCVTEERPAAILLDDVHWADDASIDVFLAAFARLAGARVLIVGAGRAGGRRVLPAERARTFGLAPLNATQLDALVGSIKPLPAAPWRLDAMSALQTASRGIPLFVLTALRDLVRAGLLRAGEVEWECDDPPELIRRLAAGDALSRTLEQLPSLAFRVIAVLAIAGRGLSQRMVLAAVDGTEPPLLLEALAEAERRALIARSGERYSLTHDLVADAVLPLLDADQRASWTQELGLACLRESDSRWIARGVRLLAPVTATEELARHLGPVLERTPLPRNVAVSATLSTWLGENTEHAALAQAVARTLPMRVRLRPFRRRATLAVASLAVVLAVVAWRAVTPPALPEAVVRAIAREGGSHIEEWRAAIGSATWDPAQPLSLRRVRTFSDSALRLGVHTGGSTDPRTGRYLEERVFSDSGASEVVAVADDGSAQRLTFSTGDDVPGSWSPDASAIAFSTSRWSETRHHAIAILDVRTGAVRRVTQSAGLESAVQWSPDGSRLAFTRRFLDNHPTQVCVIDVDGRGERCDALNAPESMEILGWSSPQDVIISVSDKSRPPALATLRADGSWHRDTLGAAVWAPTLSPFGGWVAWRGGPSGEREYRVAPLAALERARVIRMPRGAPVEGRMAWGGTGRSRPYVDSLDFTRAVDTLYAGIPHRLEALAVWSDGHRTPAPYVRWTLDDSVGTVDADGVLIARRTGAARVRVSAGGWRTASHAILVLAASPRVLLDESWADLSRWRLFGEPLPRLVSDAVLGRALSNEGDGSYFSGAYARTLFRATRGLALDALVQTPVTELQWQLLDVEFRRFTDGGALSQWDHRTGYMPRVSTSAGLESCAATYPASDGAAGRERLLFSQGEVTLAAATQRLLSSGVPYHIRLQVLPDGRCGVAINGIPLSLSDETFPRDTPLMLVTYGSAWHSRMLLGPLRITEGVPEDIDWSRVSLRRELRLPPRRTTPRPPK